MCVQQNLIRFEIFSGWFVEPHLRAVSMKIERFGCCWGSKCFPFVSHSLLLLRTHHDSVSMFIIAVDFAVPCAIVVERARFCIFFGDPASTRLRNFYDNEFSVMNAVAVWGDLKGTIVCLTLAH